MVRYNYTQSMQIESDNMLYTPLSKHILPRLLEGYPRLAATALTKNLVTASVFWIGHLTALQEFTDYMNDLAWNSSISHSNTTILMDYISYLYQNGDTKEDVGIFCNIKQQGLCIKPFAVNEMSMLAFYHSLNATQLQYLPIIPHNLPTDKKFNRLLFSRYIDTKDKLVGISMGDNAGVFDAGSYGQYLGGTSKHHGNDPGTIDGSHIIGEAMIKTHCYPVFMCTSDNDTISSSNNNNKVVQFLPGKCRMKPYVKCREQNVYTPLINIHVHSKHTSKFRNVECNCSSVVDRS